MIEQNLQVMVELGVELGLELRVELRVELEVSLHVSLRGGPRFNLEFRFEPGGVSLIGVVSVVTRGAGYENAHWRSHSLVKLIEC